ncbi:MAG: site-2 protease family protein [Ignavibacteriales bacterium]|nr:site-2 protease family protein [Ignavibacteriales bacterium]
MELGNFHRGVIYSILIIVFLLSHELGHYFAAKYHKIETSLPYFIPAPPFIVNPFGTMGAVIRMKSAPHNTNALFDVGISGPFAGFVLSLSILGYGFFTLPPFDYIYQIHPEYVELGSIPQNGLHFGNSILFIFLRSIFSNVAFIPPMNEIYHYPFLCVGWFGLFVTALNLMPIGQLDGGHITYTLFGKQQHRIIARTSFFILMAFGFLSIVSAILYQIYTASLGWLIWGLILFFVVKLDHPEIPNIEKLSFKRKIWGWTSFGIFVITFPPIPFIDLP